MSERLEEVKAAVARVRKEHDWKGLILCRVGMRYWIVDQLEVIKEWPTWLFSRLGDRMAAVSESGLAEFLRKCEAEGVSPLTFRLDI